MIIYDLQNISYCYPKTADFVNRDISFQIAQGEIFGLLGDNGAGKSTLVKQMANLLTPTEGQIRLLNRPLTHTPTFVPSQLGYMPQDGSALNSLTVAESLYFTAHLRGLSRAAARQERERLLALLQLEPLRHRSATKLSGGQKRLLQIGVAMTASPPILILDEPTNHLDPQRRQRVWEILRQENAERGTTIIFITHDAIEAEKIIERVCILRNGRLVALGRPSELNKQFDNKLRLELVFSGEPPVLPPHLTIIQQQPNRWLVYLSREEATAVFNHIDLNQLDDFRLFSATLEDLYLHYAQQPSTSAAARTAT